VLASESDGIGSRYMVVGYLATSSWLQTNGRQAQAFVSAVQRASRWGNAHHRESAEILARESKADAQIVATMSRSTYGLDLTPALIQPVIETATKYGLLNAPISARELIWKPGT
jgi:NitT/TauT family transport system substrate-binding protein